MSDEIGDWGLDRAKHDRDAPVECDLCRKMKHDCAWIAVYGLDALACAECRGADSDDE
jgi:hypothetical protein